MNIDKEIEALVAIPIEGFQEPSRMGTGYGFPQNLQTETEVNEILSPTNEYKPKVIFDMDEPKKLELSDDKKLFINNFLKAMRYKQKAEIVYHFQRMMKIMFQKNPDILQDLLKYFKEEIEGD